MILLYLEKYERKTIQDITLLLGHSNANYVANEAQYLLYNPLFNPSKSPTGGIICSNCKIDDKKPEISPTSEIWLNKEFNPPNLKPNTLPYPMKTSNAGGRDSNEVDRQEKNQKNMVIDATLTRIMKV